MAEGNAGTSSLSEQMAEARKVSGLSQAEIAERAGWRSAHTVSDVETGTRKLSVLQLHHLLAFGYGKRIVLVDIEEVADGA